MQILTKSLYSCIFSVLIISACQKKEGKPEVTPTTDELYVVVKNNTRDTINFEWRDTSSNGKANSGIRIIASDQSVKIPYSVFSVGGGSHYFYYNNDKSITNIPDIWWQGVKMIPYPNTKDFLITIADSPRLEYIKCLTANSVGTDWGAIDAYDSVGVSVWGALSLNEQNQRLAIDTLWDWWWKELRYKGYVNSRTVDMWMGTVQLTRGKFQMSCGYSSSGLKMTIMDDCRPAAPLYTTSLDTMYMKVDSIPYYYKMYRVK